MVQSLQFVPLHDTFGAECRGVDFSGDIPEDIISAVKEGLHKYGVLVFRDTGMSDDEFVAWGHRFGEPSRNKNADNRVKSEFLGDPSNIHSDGSLVQPGELQYFIGKATGIFHVDKSYNPRRARYTTLKVTLPPPPGTGGATEFADTRTAYDDLDEATKQQIDKLVGCHSIFESRRKAAPTLKSFQLLDPAKFPVGKFPIVENHKDSGRKDLYLAGHLHHIEGMSQEESTKLIDKLFQHASQEKYRLKINYNRPGDMTLWDNIAVMHRAGGGSYISRYPRDVRNMTMYDNSEEEWGFNDRNEEAVDAGFFLRKAHAEAFGNEEARASMKDEIIDWD